MNEQNYSKLSSKKELLKVAKSSVSASLLKIEKIGLGKSNSRRGCVRRSVGWLVGRMVTSYFYGLLGAIYAIFSPFI